MYENDDDVLLPEKPRPLWVGIPIEYTAKLAVDLMAYASPVARETTAGMILAKLEQAKHTPEIVDACLRVASEKLKIPAQLQKIIHEAMEGRVDEFVGVMLSSKAARKMAMELLRETMGVVVQQIVEKSMPELVPDEGALREAALEYQRAYAKQYIQTNPAYRQRLDTLAAKVIGEELAKVESELREAARLYAESALQRRINPSMPSPHDNGAS